MGSARVTVRTLEKNRVEAVAGPHRLVLDLPVSEGGEEPVAGMGTYETLLSALGGCTAMTLSLYARRKGWPLEGVEVDLARDKPAPGRGDAPDRIDVVLRLRGPLDAEQRARLAEIARKCPVYRTLTGEIEIAERLAT